MPNVCQSYANAPENGDEICEIAHLTAEMLRRSIVEWTGGKCAIALREKNKLNKDVRGQCRAEFQRCPSCRQEYKSGFVR
jgi:hypothetical protein